jgi:hypothetical protein
MDTISNKLTQSLWTLNFLFGSSGDAHAEVKHPLEWSTDSEPFRGTAKEIHRMPTSEKLEGHNLLGATESETVEMSSTQKKDRGVNKPTNVSTITK